MNSHDPLWETVLIVYVCVCVCVCVCVQRLMNSDTLGRFRISAEYREVWEKFVACHEQKNVLRDTTGTATTARKLNTATITPIIP